MYTFIFYKLITKIYIFSNFFIFLDINQFILIKHIKFNHPKNISEFARHILQTVECQTVYSLESLTITLYCVSRASLSKEITFSYLLVSITILLIK